MKLTGPHTILSAADASTNQTSTVVYLTQTRHALVVATLTGSPVGTLTLQESADASTYVTISTAAVTSAGSYAFDVPFISGQTIRLVWTVTSGTGTITAKATTKD